VAQGKAEDQPGLRFQTVVEDVEQTQLSQGYSVVLAVLLLEHVNWRRAVVTMCALAEQAAFVVIQENPPGLATALSPNRTIAGTMKVFLEVHPQLVSRESLEAEFSSNGFLKNYEAEKNVSDGKKMVALGFQKVR
jgi:hypothetical protein